MAEISILTKTTRLRQNRPPLNAETDCLDAITRLDLPRYLPPVRKPPRTRSQPVKKAEPDEPRPVESQPFRISTANNGRPAGSSGTPGPMANKQSGGQGSSVLRPGAVSLPGINGISRNGNGKATPHPLQKPQVQPAAVPKEPAKAVEPEANTSPSEEPAKAVQSFFGHTPSLREVLTKSAGIPAHTIILGVVEDGLPVLLDLQDPAPGSLLIVGDERQQELDLLRSALASVILRNSARGVQFIVFSHLPEAWRQWVGELGWDRYCLDVVGADTSAAQEWIDLLSGWSIERQANLRSGPPVIILFDTLSFMTRLADETREKLDDLIQTGPRGQFWPVAAVSTALANSLGRQLDVFKTRIVGFSEDASVYSRLAGVDQAGAKSFGQSGQFVVRVGSGENAQVLKFRVPGLASLFS